MIVNFLGCDGAGKTTAINQCKAHFESYKRVVVLNKWGVLGNSNFGAAKCFVSEIDKVKDSLSVMDPHSRFLLTTLLFSVQMSQVLEDYSPEMDLIILDGFWHKQLINELCIGTDASWMKSVCSFLRMPDLTIVLDVDPEIAFSRKTTITDFECGLKQRTKLNFISHQTKVREELKRYLMKNINWVMVDANRNVDIVVSNVISIIDEYIHK